MKNEKITQEALKLYNPKLPYHNFEHIQKVLEVANTLMRDYDTHNINKDVIYYAILFHDAGFHEDSAKKGFPSKEEYSAFLAKQVLEKFDFDRSFIEKVQKVILSTHRDATISTPEEKIVRLADLENIASDYKIFRENTGKLKKEFELMTGNSLSEAEWKKCVAHNLEGFLKQELDPVFNTKARANLQKYLKEK